MTYEYYNMPPGLAVLPDFIDIGKCRYLACAVDDIMDHDSLRLDLPGRSVSQYSQHNYWYDFKSRTLEPTDLKRSLPSPLWTIRNELEQAYGFPIDHVMVNRYENEGQIKPHVDASCFGDVIFTLSLGHHCHMVFKTNLNHFRVPLQAGSLMLMCGEARWEYQHSVDMRETNSGLEDRRRWSITFRSFANRELV